jgi:hypothetical protein
VRAALAPGGRFALEVQMLAELLAPRFAPRVQGRAGPFQVRNRRDWNRSQGRLQVRYELQRDPHVPGAPPPPRETHRASYRIHTLAELQALLLAAGLRPQALLGRHGAAFRADEAREDPNACLRVVCSAAD